ncbi:hypothetical protein EJ03DRAFT_365566 [Teratosphaeria nubilosa]|uniref:Integral membrane protein n=1 Tax=Teratosphaeria nubilosa TaxID=161662 RepID=A0A6G1L3I0_9PEZI|nr:hypothetical protein EJ03DRAFT_365566 [Teratosphaeria nubilosa]
MQQAGITARQNRGLRRFRSGTVGQAVHPRHRTAHDEYESDVVDLLDLVDPEVRTIGTLTNVQNSLFVPDLGGLLNRRPTYELTTRRSDLEGGLRSRAGTRASQRPPTSRLPTVKSSTGAGIELEMEEQQPRRTRAGSLTSQLSDSHYAVLPHGVDLEGWTKQDIDELNDHVRHLLHSRREGFKRGMRGFRKYLSKPLGLFVFVYATLVTLFGAAWVFCLIGWIYVGNKQDYFINVIDNVLVALFALIGDGLAPFRAVDTYHMCFIAHYHHLTWRLRQEKKLPNLVDHNDLPDRRVSLDEQEDIIDKEETAEFSVLSPRQQRRLQYHQAKFSKAHTFYKPHETSTHHAFPLRLLVAVVVLLDCHSLFQVALGTCTWSIDYHVRPQALTATILSCSITCNIVAGILISIGDHRTRKKDVLERMFRQGLTEEAIVHIQKKKTMQEGIANDVDDVADGSTSGTDVRHSKSKSRPSGDDIEPAGWASLGGSSSLQEKGKEYTV